jgi:GH43 family beta-xylosidase
MLKREDIRIRDPFILPENGIYYMYGTTDLEDGSLRARNTFAVYTSTDLENFSEPKVVVDAATLDFWGSYDFWAPEVHKYNGRYYLFGSCKAQDMHRATQIFVCDTPDGEFIPLADTARTPADWECLDGTFFIDNGKPYMVFCHEWTQIKNGEIHAMPLSDDLTHPIGEPVLLFRATDNPQVTGNNGNYVTDGPFLFREDGKIKMIWSSFANGRYVVLEAQADSLLGPWTHFGSRFDFDGGHAMLFTGFDGKRRISLHAPNKANLERPVFFEY